jgi:hypothetical protein
MDASLPSTRDPDAAIRGAPVERRLTFCASAASSSPARARPPGQSTTASSAGRCSPAFSTTASSPCPANRSSQPVAFQDLRHSGRPSPVVPDSFSAQITSWPVALSAAWRSRGLVDGRHSDGSTILAGSAPLSRMALDRERILSQLVPCRTEGRKTKLRLA